MTKNQSKGWKRIQCGVGVGGVFLAYDSELHLAYCASSQGQISVVALAGEKLNVVETVAAGGKSVVVDPKTHTVWNAYSKGDQSFVQPFTPSKP